MRILIKVSNIIENCLKTCEINEASGLGISVVKVDLEGEQTESEGLDFSGKEEIVSDGFLPLNWTGGCHSSCLGILKQEFNTGDDNWFFLRKKAVGEPWNI